MDRLLLVGIGGLIGSVLRYGGAGLVQRLRIGAVFPYGTLAVNIVGCLAIGFLASVAESRGVLGPAAKAFVFIGLLGGFTTFSTFGYETFQMLRDGQMSLAMTSVALHAVFGIGAVWAGDAAAGALWGR